MLKLILLLVTFSLSISQPKSPQDFVWENRILIIKSDEGLVGWPIENHRQNLEDRKLLVFHFSNEKLVNTNCQDQVDTTKFLKKLNQKSGENIQWVLIGLDGGIKKSGNEVPNPEEIFKVIDAMPMRQSEIRKLTNWSF